MLESMTSVQALEWEAMFDRWNVGDHPNFRADTRMGIVSSILVNVNRRRGRAAKPSDFMPKFERQEELGGQAPDALRAGMMALARKSPKPRANRGRSKSSDEPTE